MQENEFETLKKALKQIGENQRILYEALKKQSKKNKKLQKDINEIKKQKKENDQKVQTLVNMAGSVQGVVAKDIASCRSDIQKILQKL